MKKPYESHEIVYQQMRKKNILTWGQKGSGTTGKSCLPETNKFLKDVLSQPWAPKSGRAIELGCGTGPILKSICKNGFDCLGIDVSKTAIAMAKEQSKGLDIKFLLGDACSNDVCSFGKFDLVIDGLCFHCITHTKDRKAYLNTVSSLLKEEGLFVLLTMCGPMNKKKFAEICKNHKLIGKTVYVPFEDKSYGRLIQFRGKHYLPSRHIGHWREILSELSQAGFELKLIRYNTHNNKDFCGTLAVGAMKK